MSKGKKDLHNGLSNQGSLFDTKVSEGSLDLSMAFRDTLTRLFSGCKDSRFIIAAKISEASKKDISKDMLDKCTSSNTDYGLRAEHLPAVCYVTHSLDPARVLLAPLGAAVLGPEEADYVRLARLVQEDQKRQLEIAQLKARLGIKDI
jgi:hypothetical protein